MEEAEFNYCTAQKKRAERFVWRYSKCWIPLDPEKLDPLDPQSVLELDPVEPKSWIQSQLELDPVEPKSWIQSAKVGSPQQKMKYRAAREIYQRPL